MTFVFAPKLIQHGTRYPYVLNIGFCLSINLIRGGEKRATCVCEELYPTAPCLCFTVPQKTESKGG